MGPVLHLAPAKLNLFLHVVGRRADGYHELQTVFRFVDHGDRLAFEPRADGVVRRVTDVPGVSHDDDLVVRAARLLRQATGTSLGADIVMDKRLPLGGGLGGGSSDAATTLMALNALWKTGLDRQALQTLGLRLGADVPVFVFGRSAWAEGVGERLQPIELPPAWYTVLIPPVAVSTAAIFGRPELTRHGDRIKLTAFSTGCGRNDLEPVVCALYPEVAEFLGWLSRFGAARMTGSGACVFCPFDNADTAERVFASRPRHWAGFVARGLDRHPLYDVVGD